MEQEHLIGVISDTHGLLRPQAVAAMKGVGTIVHAGDIGSQEILDGLRKIAPVVAVRGNMDSMIWCRHLPLTETVTIGDIMLYVLHDIGDLDLNPSVSGFGAVIYGHSHRPAIAFHNGVLYLNPGSAGPRRFRLPVTLALLKVRGTVVTAEIVLLG